ncbi:hypothetical protein SARC_05606, partial [Sphaeroforma arctica JP610]
PCPSNTAAKSQDTLPIIRSHMINLSSLDRFLPLYVLAPASLANRLNLAGVRLGHADVILGSSNCNADACLICVLVCMLVSMFAPFDIDFMWRLSECMAVFRLSLKLNGLVRVLLCLLVL